MKVESFTSVEKFWDNCHDYLLADEAKNNLFFSLLSKLRLNKYVYGDDDPNMFVVYDDENLVSFVSLQTPPYNLIVSSCSNENIFDFFATYLKNEGYVFPGVIGAVESSKQFAVKWCQLHESNFEIVMNERIYQLDSVNSDLIGDLMAYPAGKSDLDLILDWSVKCSNEIFGRSAEDESIDRKKLREGIFGKIEKKHIYVLVDKGEIVTMAQISGETPNGHLISGVYTPADLRKRGYASECVAKLSQYILDQNKKHCFLFTDLSNPTSNKIYINIGYKEVCDIDMYKFID